MPWLGKNYYGWNSAYQSQEMTGNGGATNVAVTYYPGSVTGPTLSLNPRGRSEVYMGAETRVGDGWQGSAKLVRSSGNGLIATAAHHSYSAGAIGYLGFKAGGRDLYVPLVKKNSSGWDAALVIQNVAGVNATVTVRFYYPGGGSAGSVTPFALTPGASRELYTELPSGFDGSVWVHSDGADVVAVVHANAGRSYGYGAVP